LFSLNALSDPQLLQLLKQDDRLAFEELYERHWLSLYNIAYKRLKDPETCKDIVQDIYADLWHKRMSRDIRDLLPYLHTAVRNNIYTLLSKGRATAHFVEPFENMAISSLTADGFFDEAELRRLMHLWMEILPAKRREIFRLRFIEDLSTKEISEQLNISQKTVQNQLLLAINGLKAHMGNILTLAILVCFAKK
jgi:RNA polymerase sigma-70 factor (family 1)